MIRRPQFVASVRIARTSNGAPSWTVEVQSAPEDAAEAQRLAVSIDADLQERLQRSAPADWRLA